MPAETLFAAASLAGLAAAWWGAARARRVAAGTTLVSPRRWLIGGLSLLSAAWLANRIGLPAADRMDYLAAVALLAAPVAVLGARRPGAGVWSWFVVLPMLCVLGLPAISGGLWRGRELEPLRLELPALAGIALVLVMGVGNYVGTRFAPAALAFGLGAALLVYPASEFADQSNRAVCHAAAYLALGLSAWMAARSARRPPAAIEPLDGLWIEFRDLFGIVWAKRALERVNHSARAQRWPVRLDLAGFVPADGGQRTPIDAETAGKIEALLRWLLKRFVDDAWIDQRLHRENPPQPTAPVRSAGTPGDE